MAGKKVVISLRSIFYTAVSLVWVFGLSAIGHIIMVLIEKYNPAIKYDFAWACVIIGILALYSTRFMKSDGWQSFVGCLAGLSLWFAFEYSLMYGGHDMGVTYTWNGSYPEYRMMKWTYMLLFMVFLYLLFQESVRCNFIFLPPTKIAAHARRRCHGQDRQLRPPDIFRIHHGHLDFLCAAHARL